MSSSKDPASGARRELTQLLALQARILETLVDLRDRLTHQQASDVIKAYHRVSRENDRPMSKVLSGVEQVIRDLQVAESEVRTILTDPGSNDHEDSPAGLPDMPPRLVRFLAQRSETPGFEYEVLQDEVRGWVVRWKEYTAFGTVRGHGQFYERPYAWLDD
jgi:hypothetical protein